VPFVIDIDPVVISLLGLQIRGHGLILVITLRGGVLGRAPVAPGAAPSAEAGRSL
jgi:hypothetical protein